MGYTQFQATGSVNNLNKKAENPRSGRKLTARCPDNVDAVRDFFGRSLKKSLQRHSERILKKDLQLYPYRSQIKHKLLLTRGACGVNGYRRRK